MLKHEPSWTARVSRRVLLDVLGSLRGGQLELVCPDKTCTFGDASAELRASVEVYDERVFSRVLVGGGDVGFGESYVDGDWSSPDLVSAIRLMVRNLSLFDERNRFYSVLSRGLDRLRHALRSNTPGGSRRNIGHHYDLGNEFYRLFLDRSMAYSSAFYETSSDTLEYAQIQKFDRICRKLQLGPGDHLLEIGTGWGGFAIHAASRYGCRVTTTTISHQQHAYASDWLKRTGLDGRVRLLLEDYRTLHGRYDKIVSIEMFEAVGFENYDQYFGACNRLLSPHGTMLLQAITMPDRRFDAYRRRCDWIQKHIFPGAELASVSGILQSLARSTQLQLFHAEDIGMHYARTLRDWRQRFVSSLPEVRRLGFGERFIRMWSYYLASCEAAFQERGIGDVQLLLTKATCSKPLWGEPPSAGSHASRRWASQAPHKDSISQQHDSVTSSPIAS